MQKYNANHTKQFRGIRIVFVVFALCLVVLPPFVSAYYLLEPLPQAGGALKEATLSTYLSWLFRFALAAAAFLAVLQITIGGIQMIFGGASETARTNAKTRIQDAIWGLVLALGSVLILTTISTQFKDMKLDIPAVTVEKITPTGIPMYQCYYPKKGSGLVLELVLKEGYYKTKEDCNKICETYSKGSNYEYKNEYCKPVTILTTQESSKK